MKALPLSFLLLAAGALHTLAGGRTGGVYSTSTEVLDASGGRATSLHYSHDGSMEAIAGIATAAAPATTAKTGYTAQLQDVTALNVLASPTTVNETTTRQLSAQQTLDDLTTVPLAATQITWSVVSGPVTAVSSAGVATAGTVYQNTAATVQGAFAGLTGTLALTVIDNIPDNFGAYAADGVGDDWQVLYFGLNNPNAGPAVDFSGNGHTNLFKYIAGLHPLDPASRFTVQITPVPGFPGQKKIIFNPVVSGRTYVVKGSAALSGWTAINASAPSDAGTERTITDLTATGARKFYHVEITKP